MPTRGHIPASRTRNSSERGSSLIEFLLCTSLMIIPLLLGTAVVGLNLVREIQVTELCRDAAHMYSEGIDFTVSSNVTQLLKIAQGLNITATGGNGVIIMSTITLLDSTQCAAGGYSSGCSNVNKTVFLRQVVVGNSTLYKSAFGTPTVDSSNSDNVTNYYTDPTAVATGFSPNVMTMSAGQYVYIAEVYFTTPELSWWSKLGTTGVSARFIF